MGWDAHSEIDDTSRDSALATFKVAAEEVRRIAGSVDCLLERGGLDCSACRKALEEATDGKLNTWASWKDAIPGEELKNLIATARWDRHQSPRWAVLSAKYWLETCAELGLSVYFSY